jgi:hypothetical protein
MTKTFKGRLIVTGVAACLVGALASGGCGEPAAEERRISSETADSGAPTPCQQAFGAACGAACSDAMPCAPGLYCDGAICTADCISDTDCKGRDCSSEGRCVEKEDGDPGIKVDPPDLDASVGGSDGAPTCIEGQVEFTEVLPQIWLLLDRSGSMTESLGTTSRWRALGAVILGDPLVPEDRGIVGAFEGRAAFGAVFYTSGSAAGGCVLDLESVAPATNNYTKIRQRYEKLSPSGGTPTADSVAATVAEAVSRDLTGGPKILVLATDGEPGGCAPRPDLATVEVEKEVSKAFAKGITTFAISISTDTNPSHMQRVANLGVGLPADANPPAPFYTAQSQEELKLAFSAVVEQVPRTCVFSLNGEVDAKNADKGSVVLAGVELAYGDANGWILKQADQVELVGAACEEIRAGEEDLDITFPCEVFTPVVK